MEEPLKELLSLSAMRRAAFSLGLLGLYFVGQRTPIPFLTFSEGVLEGAARPSLFLFNLSFNSFVVGFLLVELFSLLVPAGRKLRRRGVGGRRTLQRAAVLTSLAVVGVQAWGISVFFSRLDLIETSSPSLTRLWLLVSLIGGAALLYWLVDKATDFGLMNGFCLLFGYGMVMSFLRSQETGEPAEGRSGAALLVSGVLIVALAIGVWRFLVSPPTVAVTDSDLSSRRLEVPPFPASIVPASMVVILWNLPWIGSSQSGIHGALPVEPEPSGPSVTFLLLAIVLGIPFLSWLGYRMFAHPKRLESDLIPPTAGLLGNAHRVVWQRFLLATVILTAGPLAFAGLFWFTSLPLLKSLFFVQVVLLTALAVDLVDQLRLSRRGETVKLLDLDNVHLAAYLKALFRSEGVDMEIQGYHFRRLLFLFGPLYKMQVRVAKEDEDRAWAILEGLEVEEV